MYTYMYTTTPISVFMSYQKKGQKYTLARQTLGVTDVKHGMHAQVDFGSDLGGVPPGYTFPLVCNVKKCTKKKTTALEPKEFDPRTHLIYIFVCKYVCTCV